MHTNLYSHRPAAPPVKAEVLQSITVNSATLLPDPMLAWVDTDQEWLYATAWAAYLPLAMDLPLKNNLIRRCQGMAPPTNHVDEFFDNRFLQAHRPAQVLGVCLPIASYGSEPFILIGENGVPLFGVHPAFFLGMLRLLGTDVDLWVTNANPAGDGVHFAVQGSWAGIVMPRQTQGLSFQNRPDNNRPETYAALEVGVATAAGIFYADDPRPGDMKGRHS